MESMSVISDEEKVLWQAIDTRIERDMMRLCAARKEEKTTWVERGERHPSRKTGASLASQIPPQYWSSSFEAGLGESSARQPLTAQQAQQPALSLPVWA